MKEISVYDHTGCQSFKGSGGYPGNDDAMTMKLRILGPGDENLLIDGVDLTDEGPLDQISATKFLADDALICVTATSKKKVVGFIYGYLLRRFEATSLFIYSVDTHEAYQRRGVAHSMMQLLDEHGRKGNWDEMFVFTNASNNPAMLLYKKAGGVRPNPDDVMFDFFCKQDADNL